MDGKYYLRYGFWPRYGKVMLRLRGKFYSIDAPWRRPLFTERNRIRCKVIPLGFGWRIIVRDI